MRAFAHRTTARGGGLTRLPAKCHWPPEAHEPDGRARRRRPPSPVPARAHAAPASDRRARPGPARMHRAGSIFRHRSRQ